MPRGLADANLFASVYAKELVLVALDCGCLSWQFEFCPREGAIERGPPGLGSAFDTDSGTHRGLPLWPWTERLWHPILRIPATRSATCGVHSAAMNAPGQAGSASGAAKWAAVVLLSASAGGGAVYSLTTRSSPTAASSAPLVQPAPQPAAPPVIVQVMPATVQPAPIQPAQIQPAISAPAQAPAPTTQPAPTPQPVAPQPQPAPIPQSPTPAPFIPAPQVLPQAPHTPPTPASAARKININTASQSELELLPSVGPAIAKRIIEHREKHGPFRTAQELDNVKGIGEKTLAKLLPLITVEAQAQPR